MGKLFFPAAGSDVAAGDSEVDTRYETASITMPSRYGVKVGHCAQGKGLTYFRKGGLPRVGLEIEELPLGARGRCPAVGGVRVPPYPFEVADKGT